MRSAAASSIRQPENSARGSDRAGLAGSAGPAARRPPEARRPVDAADPAGAAADRGGFVLGGRGRSQNAYNLQSNYSFGGSALDSAPYQLQPGSSAQQRPVLAAELRRDGRRPGADPRHLQGRPADELHGELTPAIAAATSSISTRPCRPRRCAPGTSPSVPVPLIDPATGLPFPGNQIPTDRAERRLVVAAPASSRFRTWTARDAELPLRHDECVDVRQHQPARDAQLHAERGRPRRPGGRRRRRRTAAGSAAGGGRRPR